MPNKNTDSDSSSSRQMPIISYATLLKGTAATVVSCTAENNSLSLQPSQKTKECTTIQQQSEVHLSSNHQNKQNSHAQTNSVENATGQTCTFVSFSFELPILQTGGNDTVESEKSTTTANNTLISQLRYIVDEVASKVDDSQLKIQIYTPESHGTITDDGIRCRQCNISMIGMLESCIRVKQLLIEGHEFEMRQKNRLFIPLSLEESMEDLQSLEEKLAAEHDVELEFGMHQFLQDSSLPANQQFSGPYFDMMGKRQNIAQCTLELTEKLNALSGNSVESLEIPSDKPQVITKVLGPQMRKLLNTMLEHKVKIDINSAQLVRFVNHSDADRMKRDVEKQKIIISASSSANCKSALAALEKEMSEKNSSSAAAINISSKTIQCAKEKVEILLIRDSTALHEIAFKYGVYVEIVQMKMQETKISIHGTHLFLINSALEDVCSILNEYHSCTIYLEDEPEHLNYKMSEFDSFECVPTKLRIISQRTETEITASGNSICVYGRESKIAEALEYLKKVKLIQNHLKSCSYEIQKPHEIRDFICGKKDGKINKIVKETGVEIEMTNLNECFLSIKLNCNSIAQIPQTLALLNGEFPAEISFYVPEFHHKRIIGHGGKNIQRIMKKFGVYIKFLNFEECLARNGHPSVTWHQHSTKILPNVIVKTPYKNKDVLANMKQEVLQEANEEEITCCIQEFNLPFKNDCFLNVNFNSCISTLSNEHSVDFFLSANCEKLIIKGMKKELDKVSEKLTQSLPVDCITFQKPVVNSTISSQWLQKINCFFLRQVETSVAKKNEMIILSTHASTNSSFSSSTNISLPNESSKLPSPIRRSIPSLLGGNSMLELSRQKATFKGFENLFFADSLDNNNNNEESSLSGANLMIETISNSTIADSTAKKTPPGLIVGPKKKEFSFWTCPFDAATTPILELPSTLAKERLEALLKSLDLSKYLTNFLSHEIDYASLCYLTDADLKEIGIFALGARKKLLQAFKQIGHEEDAADSLVGGAGGQGIPLAKSNSLIALPSEHLWLSASAKAANIAAPASQTSFLFDGPIEFGAGNAHFFNFNAPIDFNSNHAVLF